jgi:predicted subunit of tRNA(5-methylaminomethyl-2-thiouridylate) methyltransferase
MRKKRVPTQRAQPAGKQVALLFSGGRDSSLACALLARKGCKIHLLTYDNGAILSSDLAEIRHRELVARFPDAMVKWRVLPSYGLFKELALTPLEEDFRRYHTNLVCMGCKMAMHTLSLVYCLEHGIRMIADGYTGYQKDWVEQMPEAIQAIRRFHQSHGVKYVNPIYDFTSQELVKKKLFAFGLSPKPLEGSCLFGGTFSIPDPANVVAYIKAKLPICQQFIKDSMRDLARL